MSQPRPRTAAAPVRSGWLAQDVARLSAAATGVPPAAVQLAAAGAAQTISVLPLQVNLEQYQGDDWFIDIEVTDPGTGQPSDLTGSDPRAEIHASTSDQAALATFVVTIDAAPGLLHLHLPAAESADLPASAVWDLQLTAPYVSTIAAGTVTCQPQVTR